MKIKTWIKYDEGYLPTPRCRKLRYRWTEDYVEAELKEVSKDALIPAFEVDSYDALPVWTDGRTTIYEYGGRFWREAVERDIHCEDEANPMCPLDALIYAHVTYSIYFGRYKYGEDHHETREEVISKLKASMKQYLLVDGTLYVPSAEPLYYVITFGLGHNHAGIGTSLSIGFGYNSNLSKDVYFNALEYDKALAVALKTAERRGDTDSLEYIRETTPIKVFDKRFVKHNPQKEHGNGNSFLNDMESVISSSKDTIEAGLLTMAMSVAMATN